MSEEALPATDHVSRFCAKRHVIDGRITGGAFQLRYARATRLAEESLSVNWLEFLECEDRAAEVAEIRRIFAKKRFDIHKRDRFAVGQVGDILKNVQANSSDGRKLDVFHEPEADDASHSGIHGLLLNDDLIYGELIAEMCQESYPARSS